MFAGIFSNSILFRKRSFSDLAIFAFFNNLNIRTSGVNVIYFLSILRYLKQKMLMKLGIFCQSSLSKS